MRRKGDVITSISGARHRLTLLACRPGSTPPPSCMDAIMASASCRQPPGEDAGEQLQARRKGWPVRCPGTGPHGPTKAGTHSVTACGWTRPKTRGSSCSSRPTGESDTNRTCKCAALAWVVLVGSAKWSRVRQTCRPHRCRRCSRNPVGVNVVSGQVRTALSSRRQGDRGAGFDCRSDRCGRRAVQPEIGHIVFSHGVFNCCDTARSPA
jgi:hypothetical protein